MSSGFTIYPLGDHAITIEFGEQINHETNQQVLSLFHYLQSKPFQGLLDLIPAYTTLTVVYDVFQLKQYCQKTQTVYDWLEQRIVYILQTQQLKFSPTKRSISIPVCYHQTVAPDKQWLAGQHKITEDQVIRLHTGTTYHVYMLGFLPGFPYMAAVHEKLVTPRKNNPRKLVPAGSVGIAGNQTGIYPFASPGGWQLIGQTPIKIFDINRKEAALLQPGDEVTFYSISLEEFNHQQQT